MCFQNLVEGQRRFALNTANGIDYSSARFWYEVHKGIQELLREF